MITKKHFNLKNNQGSIIPLAFITILILGVTLEYAIKKSGEVDKQDATRRYDFYKLAEYNKIKSALQNQQICTKSLAGYTVSSSFNDYKIFTSKIQNIAATNIYLDIGTTVNYGDNYFGVVANQAFIHLSQESTSANSSHNYELIINYSVVKGSGAVQKIASKFSNKIPLVVNKNASGNIISCYASQDRDGADANNTLAITNSCISSTNINGGAFRFQYGQTALDVSGNAASCATRIDKFPTANPDQGTDCALNDSATLTTSFSAINGFTFTPGANLTAPSKILFTCGTWKTQTCSASGPNYTDANTQLAYSVDLNGNLNCRDPLNNATSAFAPNCIANGVSPKASVLVKNSATALTCIQIGCDPTASVPTLWSGVSCNAPKYAGVCPANSYADANNSFNCIPYRTALSCSGNKVMTQFDPNSQTFSCTAESDFTRSGARSTGNLYIKGNGSTTSYTTYGPNY